MIHEGIRAVFFDAVGTLIAPRVPVSRTYAEFARKHGADIDEETVQRVFREAFSRQEKKDCHDDWRTDENRERLRWRAIVEEVLAPADPEPCFTELWNWFASPEAWTAQGDTAAVLEEIGRRGLLVGIASNFDARLCGLVAKLPELQRLRERCMISSLVGWRKPAKEFFAAVAASAGCAANEILFVGDDLRNDIHGATAAGLRAVLFDPDGRGEGGQRIRQLRDLLH
jgi:putative hydrolase of the HAD superfamily